MELAIAAVFPRDPCPTIGLNYITFCVITPCLSIRYDCCSFLIFTVIYHISFLPLEQTCDNGADSFISTWDFLDHSASQIIVKK